MWAIDKTSKWYYIKTRNSCCTIKEISKETTMNWKKIFVRNISENRLIDELCKEFS
jgi:hypothetical protein